MHVTYLMNSYPRTSTTFIRREIEALEKLGVAITRFAVRDWDEALVDPLDQAEKQRTTYLLTGNIPGLFIAFFLEMVTNPGRFLRALEASWHLWRAARLGFVKHVAYLMQACHFKRIQVASRARHVHVHFSTNATSVAMLSEILGGPGYSFTVHGPDELVDPDHFSLATKIDRARFVVAITDYCKSQLLRHSSTRFATKIKVMRCGLPLDDFAEAPPVAPDNQSLVCLGRLCPQKGQALLPRIIARVVADFPEVKIILIGDGESRAEIDAEIDRYAVSDHFEKAGWMVNHEARSRLAKSRGLLLPSFAEGLPIVIMEAMAEAKPVISTYIAGIPELLDEECGWIVPAGNEEKLEAAIRALLAATPERLTQMGKEGARRVKMWHNIDDLATGLKAEFGKDTAASDRQKVTTGP